MSNKRVSISFKEVSPRIVGSLGSYRPARVQSFDVRGNFPNREITEHGNPNLAGVVYEIPEYTVTMSVLDVSIKMFAAVTGTDSTNYPAEGVSINALDDVDIIGDVKSESVSDYIKALLVRKARVQSIRFSYTVDGDSTEEYTFMGSSRYGFSHDIVVDTFSSGASSPQTLSETPEVLKSGDYAISVMLDGEYLDEVDSGPATGEYSISGTDISFADTISDMLVVVYKADPSGNNWSDVSDTTIPVAITGKDVPVEIAANNIPRVQSINVTANLRADPVREQGNHEVVGYSYQVPEVTGDFTVLDTDNELLALFATGNIDSTDTEFKSCELLQNQEIDLDIILRDPSDPCTSSGNVLKTIHVPNVQLTGENPTSNTGDNVSHTFNFRSATGNLIVYSGAI
jgi:hypothetical protein